MAGINETSNALPSNQMAVAMHTALASVLTDLVALTAAVNQLISDYNANEAIATDTTAQPVTLVTTP
jgi:type II secretory pathway component PulM